MAERMPALFIGHGNPMNAPAGEPLYAAVGIDRRDPAGTAIARLVLRELLARRGARHSAPLMGFLN